MFKRILLLMAVLMVFSHASASEHYGVDTDLIAYRIGKFPQSVFISGWYGWDHWRLSATFSYLELVEDHVLEGFDDDVVTLYGIGAAYAFSDGWSGFTVGPRLVYMEGRVTSERNLQRGNYYSLNAGINPGYIWKITPNLYVLPNVNILFPIGEKEYTIGDDVYENTWNLEPGLRVGWEF